MAKQTTSTPSGSTPKASAARQRPAAARSVSDSSARRPSAPSILSFFQESRAELRKVTWPTRQEAMNLTVAVVGMTVGIAVFLGIIDQILNYIVNPLLGTK